jgi:heme/copper-type cytochrome/quinol oxidase subunit 3
MLTSRLGPEGTEMEAMTFRIGSVLTLLLSFCSFTWAMRYHFSRPLKPNRWILAVKFLGAGFVIMNLVTV